METKELGEPVKWDRTIWRGTDHAWMLRRLDGNDLPIIPESAKAQVRSWYGGDTWVDADSAAVSGPTIEIDGTEGWVTVVIPEASTAGTTWDNREKGVWDLEVVVSGKKYRWAMGEVIVSQDVTRP